MQLKKLSPLAGLLLTALLSACGGGGGDEPPAPAAPIPPAITVSAVALSSTSPAAYAENALVFDGGVCGDGTGTLTATWDFGDGTAPVVNPGANPTHTYEEAKAGANKVTVTCEDTAGTTPQTSTRNITIQSAAMQGFLGKSWIAYSSIETNISPYPVAGIDTNGDIYGAWVRRNGGDTSAFNEVVTGTTTFSLLNWNVSTTSLDTGADRSPYVDFQTTMSTAAIDIAVSPNGRGLIAWVAGTSATTGKVWYATKASPTDPWVTTSAPIDTSVMNDSIKVVINDVGNGVINGAIAYCKNDGTAGAPILHAYAVPYLGNTAGTPYLISNKCSKVDWNGIAASATLQRSRAFDIAIDNNSNIFAAGILNATSGAAKSAVAMQMNTNGAWDLLPLRLADEIAISPESLSLSLSPNGKYAAIAWNQVNAALSNVYFSMLDRTVPSPVWSPAAAFSHDTTPTTDYTRPMIAVSDKRDAFMAMRLTSALGPVSVAVANYDASVATPAWSKESVITTPSSSINAGYRAMDIAIDNWGTGLVTNVDDAFNWTQAGTFVKKKIGTTPQWSGFKSISSSTTNPVYYRGFHYQTMRALPDGRAIVVTSTYDDDSTNGRLHIPSGYMLLK